MILTNLIQNQGNKTLNWLGKTSQSLTDFYFPTEKSCLGSLRRRLSKSVYIPRQIDHKSDQLATCGRLPMVLWSINRFFGIRTISCVSQILYRTGIILTYRNGLKLLWDQCRFEIFQPPFGPCGYNLPQRTKNPNPSESPTISLSRFHPIGIGGKILKSDAKKRCQGRCHI